MVVQSGFSLQLIDAETQQPLNEYRGPSGSVYYAEAKPGGEYFLRFQVLKDEVEKQGEAAKHETMMYFRPAVDGKDLGFYTNLTQSQGARDVGLWTYVNGIGTNQALKFDTTAVASTGGNKQTSSTTTCGAGNNTNGDVDDESSSAAGRKSPPLLHMGNVQVQISKGVFTGYQKRIYTSVPALTQEETVIAEAAAAISASSSLQEEDEDVNATGTTHGNPTDGASGSTNSKAEGVSMDPAPILRSREGAAKFQQEFSEQCPTYQPGDLLETITIHYGSTAALVQAGILVPIAGVIPEYVGVPPTPPAAVAHPPPSLNVAPMPRGSPVATQGKIFVSVPNPLLDVSSSTSPSSAKRQHGAVSEAETSKTTEEKIKQPVAKKPCHQATSEATMASAVSTK